MAEQLRAQCAHTHTYIHIYIYSGNKQKWHCQSKLKMAFLASCSRLSRSPFHSIAHSRIPCPTTTTTTAVRADTNEFKDDWNEMHIATRHSATWRNTYQPQILPYILNIVTLTAIAYSSKRIYWHRAIAENAGCCCCCCCCWVQGTQTLTLHCTWTEASREWKWQICSHPVWA